MCNTTKGITQFCYDNTCWIKKCKIAIWKEQIKEELISWRHCYVLLLIVELPNVEKQIALELIAKWKKENKQREVEQKIINEWKSLPPIKWRNKMSKGSKRGGMYKWLFFIALVFALGLYFYPRETRNATRNFTNRTIDAAKTFVK